jgi:hypothetical protein
MMVSGMSKTTIAFLQQIEKTRNLFDRAKRKIFNAPTTAPMLKIDYRGQAASDQIRARLEKGIPCLVCRIGRIELDVILRYINMQAKGDNRIKFSRYLFKSSGPYWWDDQIRALMHNNAGFIHSTDEDLYRFAEKMLVDIQGIDILGSWLPGEVCLNHLFPAAQIIPLIDLEPYYHADPWSQALEGKKVLVIHPFEATIRSQYARRSNLFRDPRVLPEFELLTLKAVQSIGGNMTGYKDWFEALDWMCEQIAKMDFDVAIIGAGAYGLPLAASVKRLGKHAIHLGGATQILFGIRGSRWDRMPFFQQLYNGYWIRPFPEETPSNFKNVERGCYW